MKRSATATKSVSCEPAAQIWIEALSPAGVELVITGWVNQNATSIVLAKGEAIRQVKLAIQAAGIVIPDATQAIEIKRERLERPIEPRESTLVEEVNATDDAALERIVDAERGLESAEDLLREESLKE